MEINKKVIFITIGLVTAVIVSAILYQFVFKKEEVEPVSPAIKIQEPKEVLAPLVTWEDPAGFSFDYPGNLQTDPHEEDDQNYAHLELSESEHPGSIIIWMKDTTYTTINDWVENEEVSEGQTFDTTLGGHEAKKVLFADGRMLTAALDAEVIVLVEMLPGESQFWPPIYDQIIESFEFIPLAAEESQPPASTGGGAEIWEEEEIIE